MQSLRVKYYLVCVSVILSTLVLMSISMLLLAYQYAEQSQRNTLLLSAENAVRLVREDYEQSETNSLNPADLRESFRVYSSFTESSVFMTDLQGRTHICTDDAPCVHEARTIPSDIIDTVVSESLYAETGRLGDFYKASYYTVALPVYLVQERCSFVMFVSKSAETTTNFLQDIMVIFLISAAIALIVAFFVVYFATGGVVRPIYEMTDAALSFSRGNFNKRIPIESGDEIARLAMSFNKMAEALRRIEHRQQDFVGSVSHELKTPMTTIGGFIDGILDGTIPQERHEHYLRVVSTEIARLSAVVKSMLDIVKLDADQITLNTRPFDIVEATVQVFLSFEKRVEEKKLTVNGLDSPALIVWADADTIMQVLYNIIDNAVKFVNTGGVLSFSFALVGDWASVSIKNSGQGIAREDLMQIFDQFYKSDKSRSAESPGTGLGLFIVKTLVELNGGRITADSAEGAYTELTFTLPTRHRKKKPTTKIRREHTALSYTLGRQDHV